MALAIRPATACDAAVAASLVTQLGYPTSPEQAGERLARLAAEASTTVLLAVEGESVVGLAVLRVEGLIEHDRPAGVLLALVVDEARRGRGVGRALVRAVEERAREVGCFAVVLNTADHRAGAHAFYQRLGYRDTGRRFARALLAEAG